METHFFIQSLISPTIWICRRNVGFFHEHVSCFFYMKCCKNHTSLIYQSENITAQFFRFISTTLVFLQCLLQGKYEITSAGEEMIGCQKVISSTSVEILFAACTIFLKGCRILMIKGVKFQTTIQIFFWITKKMNFFCDIWSRANKNHTTMILFCGNNILFITRVNYLSQKIQVLLYQKKNKVSD